LSGKSTLRDCHTRSVARRAYGVSPWEAHADGETGGSCRKTRLEPAKLGDIDDDSRRSPPIGAEILISWVDISTTSHSCSVREGSMKRHAVSTFTVGKRSFSAT